MRSEILVIAAEASSAHYAEKLLPLLQKPNLHFYGVGSQKMQSNGFECLAFAEKMAVVGLVEVLHNYSYLKSVYQATVKSLDERKPKAAILMDYPGFNLRLAKELKKRNIPVLYLIAPQVWAWKTGRVHIMRETLTRLLVLFPFEEAFFKQHQVPVDFIGHPLLDEWDEKLIQKSHVQLLRRARGIQDHEKVLALMPGSRFGEIKYILPTQIAVAREMVRQNPGLRVIVLCAPTLEKEFLQEKLADLRIPFILFKDEPFQMIALADVVLAASGTATLYVGLLQKPMVIMYRASALTAYIGRKLVKGFFGIINLIFAEQVVPERLQNEANVAHLCELLQRYLDDKAYTEGVIQRLGELPGRLGRKGALQRAADIIRDYL